MLRASCAAIDITPRTPCDLNGFGARQQPGLGVAAPLYGRALLLAGGRARAALVVCDLLGFTLADSRRLEAAIAEAADVPRQNVLLACSHTHSGPMSMPLGIIGRYDAEYICWLEARLRQLAATAAGQLGQGRVERVRLGSTHAPALGHFRCALDVPGRGRWPGTLNVLELQRSEAPPITLWHLGVHPVTLGPDNRLVHPDYPGEVCGILERETQGDAIYLPGCGADVNPPPSAQRSSSTASRYAQSVARVAMRALNEAQAITGLPLRCAQAAPPVRFGYNAPPEGKKLDQLVKALQGDATLDDHERTKQLHWLEQARAGRLLQGCRFRMRALRLGEVMLLGMPAEIFHESGRRLEHGTPPRVLVCSQTGGNLGYIPPAFAYQRDNYEAGSAHRIYGTHGTIERGGEVVIRRAAADLVRRVGLGFGPTPSAQPAHRRPAQQGAAKRA